MLVLSSSKNQNFSLHFLPSVPSFLKIDTYLPSPHNDNNNNNTNNQSRPHITWPTMTPPPSNPSSRQTYSRETSYDSQTSSYSNSHSQTIHSRRTLSRTTTSPAPPPLSGFGELFHSRAGTPISIPAPRESDLECWARMLALQREYHCYHSARLEAAVEALEAGWAIDEVPMREF